jgi:hypothetical protein
MVNQGLSEAVDPRAISGFLAFERPDFCSPSVVGLVETLPQRRKLARVECHDEAMRAECRHRSAKR